ncbi:mCG140425, isoform CRA_a [Mus musculus]|nr:mCG140425, isoform CRA_a [Mus musculus]
MAGYSAQRSDQGHQMLVPRCWMSNTSHLAWVSSAAGPSHGHDHKECS